VIKRRPYSAPIPHVHSTDVGHCIYFGSVENLTKEHIIPSGAGGVYAKRFPPRDDH
jgi:hypothetical protein